jgi:hypothetical protein
MRHSNHQFPRLTRKALCLGSAFSFALIAGCSSSPSPSSSQAVATAGPQSYFAPPAAGTTYNFGDNSSSISALSLLSPQTYTVDDQAETPNTPKFSETTYGLHLLPGSQTLNAGDVNVALQRGLLGLTTTKTYALSGDTSLFFSYTPPVAQSSGFAVELADQTGGLVQIPGQPAVPVVAATQCPSFSSAQTYQFLTIPGSLNTAGSSIVPSSWNSAVETAYGSVDIVSSGDAVTFQNIHQYTLPPVGGSSMPAQPGISSVTGTCGPTVFGNTTSVPGQLVVTDPGGVNVNAPPQAIIGIGSSGLLVEFNGVTGSPSELMPGTTLDYENILGAGTGAVGLPKPSSALSTSAVIAAQYLGFIDGAGLFSSFSVPVDGWSSTLASFGFPVSPVLPSACSAFAAQTGPLVNGIYGGDLTSAQANGSNGGYSNCDFAIDLGNEDPLNNGLYPQATVWIGASYASNPTCNTTCETYKFPAPAVAIAGQLNGKYAIFVIGVDSTQPWTIYLLQSN